MTALLSSSLELGEKSAVRRERGGEQVKVRVIEDEGISKGNADKLGCVRQSMAVEYAKAFERGC